MALYQIKIDLDKTEEFCAVIAGLVREGICFTATLTGNEWVIEMTCGN
jgi:hypothetical protein